MNNNIQKDKCQAVLRKLAIKKASNKYVIDWLEKDVQDNRTADKIKGCATQAGVTNINGITKIIRANFCRERICNVCAWRRQSKFVAQMIPVLNYISSTFGYEFIFITFTLENARIEYVSETVDLLINGYQKMARSKLFKSAFEGIIRSLELTYNEERNDFHVHLHLLAAVDKSYFLSKNYISHEQLKLFWKRCVKTNYEPYVYIEKVTENNKATLEVLKYALKPTMAKAALWVMYSVLRGRRLISFSGVFAQIRKEMKLSDFDTILTDDLPKNNNRYYDIYNFDITGGVYKFYKRFRLE